MIATEVWLILPLILHGHVLLLWCLQVLLRLYTSIWRAEAIALTYWNRLYLTNILWVKVRQRNAIDCPPLTFQGHLLLLLLLGFLNHLLPLLLLFIVGNAQLLQVWHLDQLGLHLLTLLGAHILLVLTWLHVSRAHVSLLLCYLVLLLLYYFLGHICQVHRLFAFTLRYSNFSFILLLTRLPLSRYPFSRLPNSW